MLVSVVVVSHNYGRYLRDAISSALAQSDCSVEVVVVDDGSTDGSVAVAKEFGSRITLIEQENVGHIGAVNAGFAASKGGVVIFLDADDLLYPECAKQIVASWRGEISKIQYRLDTINGAGVDQNMQFPHFPKDMGSDDILRWSLRFGWYPWPVSSGNAYARGYLEKLLPIPNPPIYKSPDGYLNRMAPLFGDVLTMSDVLGAYRVHGNNRWAQSGADQIARVSCEWVHFDKILNEEFELRARHFGFQPVRYNELCSLQRIEYRFLARRFDAGSSVLGGDRLFDLLRVGLTGIVQAPHLKTMGRLAWLGWFLALALLPKEAVAKVFVKSRGQIGRAALFKFVVGLSRRHASHLLFHLAAIFGLHDLQTFL